MTSMAVVYIDSSMLPCYIGVALSEKGFRAEMKRLKRPEFGDDWLQKGAVATMHTLCLEAERAHVHIICFDMKALKCYSYNQTAGVVAHETMHIWQYIKEWLGERGGSGLSNFGNELEAYTFEHLFKGVLDQVLPKQKQCVDKRKKT